MKNLNCQIDQVLCQVLKIILGILSKKHETLTDNPPIRMYVHKIENRTSSRAFNTWNKKITWKH